MKSEEEILRLSTESAKASAKANAMLEVMCLLADNGLVHHPIYEEIRNKMHEYEAQEREFINALCSK